jgi:hypothetical protein
MFSTRGWSACVAASSRAKRDSILREAEGPWRQIPQITISVARGIPRFATKEPPSLGMPFRLGSVRASRAGDGAPAVANFFRLCQHPIHAGTPGKDCFGEGAKTSTLARPPASAIPIRLLGGRVRSPNPAARDPWFLPDNQFHSADSGSRNDMRYFRKQSTRSCPKSRKSDFQSDSAGRHLACVTRLSAGWKPACRDRQDAYLPPVCTSRTASKDIFRDGPGSALVAVWVDKEPGRILASAMRIDS